MNSNVRCWQDRHTRANAGSVLRPYKAELRLGAICVPPPGLTLPVLWHPTFEVTGDLETPGGVYVFGETKSTKNSIILNLIAPTSRLDHDLEAHRSLCGAVISMNWPWHQLAVCIGLLAEDGYLGDAGLGQLQFDLEKDAMLRKYRNERGLCLPVPKIIVYARPIRYVAEVCSGRPVYGTDDAVAYPLSCAGQVCSNDWRVAKRIEAPLQIGAKAVVIDPACEYYGGMCEIISTKESGESIARIESRPTASHAPAVALAVDLQGPWMTIEELCAAARVSTSVAQQLVQDLHFRFKQTSYDLGLHFRFFKRGLLRAGFVRRQGHCMHGKVIYSPKAMQFIAAYKAHVPELFDALGGVEAKRAQQTKTRIGKGSAGEPFVAAELLGQDVAEHILDRCAAFRESHLAEIWSEPLYHNCSAVLDSKAVKELEGYLDSEIRQPRRVDDVVIDRSQLLMPGALADSQHEIRCGDVSSPARSTLGSRVCYTMSSGPCEFGTTGTVVGIHPPKSPDETSIGWTLDLIIQSSPKQRCAIGGSSLGGRCSALRGVSVPASHVVNIGKDSSYPETTTPVEQGFTDAETLSAVKEQIEFYLSDSNLPKDSYFAPLVRQHPDGFVGISKFLSCKRIKQLTTDSSLVAEACRGSALLVVSTDGSAIRRVRPWASGQRANQHRKERAGRETTGQNKQITAAAAAKSTHTSEEPEGTLRRATKPSAVEPAVKRTAPKRSMRARRTKDGKRRDLPEGMGTALVAVATTIAAAQVPLHYRSRTILALSIWPTCLLGGQAAAQAAQPTRKGIMKPTPLVVEEGVQEYSYNTAAAAAAAAIASGIAVVISCCARTESLRLLYERPSVDVAVQILTLASAQLHDNLKVTSDATSMVPLLLSSKPGAAVVALSLMPFGYLCGRNYLQ
eukprot:COSAG02_NODE_1376_length_12993_cov_56.849542_5_plen_905_part_00